jgi:hypothetical protein
MDLLKDIDQQAQVYEFASFLNELDSLDVDKAHELIIEYVDKKIQMLDEIDRGDMEIHRAMAQKRGYQGVGADPQVAKKLDNPSIGLEKDIVRKQADPKNTPSKGELLRHNGVDYVVVKANGPILHLVKREEMGEMPTAKISKLSVAPDSLKQNRRSIQKFPQKSGKNAWMVREKPSAF